jgi:hypothetical protein
VHPLDEKFIPDSIARKSETVTVPHTASVGQTIVVKAVDENGKPTEWEAVDFPSGGGGYDVTALPLLADITLEEDVTNPSFSLSKTAKRCIHIEWYNAGDEATPSLYPRVNEMLVDMPVDGIDAKKYQWQIIDILEGGCARWRWTGSQGNVWDGTGVNNLSKAMAIQYDWLQGGIWSVGRTGTIVAGSRVRVWGE